jgi:DNA-binding Lrp family transcriptional regulator
MDEARLNALKEQHAELAMYESGLSETEIGRQLRRSRSTVQARLERYRAAGVLVGNRKANDPDAVVRVDWKALADVGIKPPKRYQEKGSGGQPAARPAPAYAPTSKELTAGELRLLKGLAAELTVQELRVLKEITQERLQAKEKGPLRSGQRRGPTSFTPDTGLWQALIEWADEKKITKTEALNQAIEVLICGFRR